MKLWKNMSIRKKLIISYSLVTYLIIGANTVGYICTTRMLTAENKEFYKHLEGWAGLLILLVSLATVIFIGLDVIRSIRKSIQDLTEASKKLALGDNDILIEKRNNDEFGVLVDQFNQMIENNKEETRVVRAVADGNLTVDIVPKSEIDILGNSIKKLVETNRKSLSSIDDAAGSVMVSASEVAAASESLAQGSTEQASAIEEITASIDDVAGKTKQNAKEAEIAAGKMRDAIASMNKGNQSMNHMVDAMTDINAASENISKIIKVIDDIAFQTNILALNAAVEAARAGEAGMGFAVVAEEVRNLAAKSSQAAAETAELIEQTIKKIHVGAGIASETARALEEISEVVTESEGIVNSIAESSGYQANAMEQIDQAVGQVSTVVQTNSATSQQCAAASEELSNQAKHMRSMLSVYDLGKGTKPSDSEYRYTPAENTDRNEQIISLGGSFGKY